MLEKFGFKKAEKPSEKESPLRFRLAFEAMIKACFSKVEIIGRENLGKIPEGKKVIIVTSHATDLDVPAAAYALMKDFNLLVAHQSVQTLLNEPGVSVGIDIIGRNNFFPLEYEGSARKNNKRGVFNPDNIQNFKRYSDENDMTPLIAAHNPSANWQLEKGGLGAVFLAQLMKNAVILPVAVDIKKQVGMAGETLKTLKSRSNATVIIGEPIELPEISEITEVAKRGQFNKIIGTKEKFSEQDKEKFSELTEQSKFVMKKLASLLPEEKRGAYSQ